VAWTKAHLHTKCHLDPSSLLATTDMGRKLWKGALPFLGRGTGSPSNTVPWAVAYLHTKWHVDASSRLATIEMGRKLGAGSPSNTYSHLATTDMGQKLGVVPLWGGGAGSPSNTMCPGPEAYLHLDPSNRLATAHQRYRQDRQWTDSIG